MRCESHVCRCYFIKVAAHLDEPQDEEHPVAQQRAVVAPKHSCDRPDIGIGFHDLDKKTGIALDCAVCGITKYLLFGILICLAVCF